MSYFATVISFVASFLLTYAGRTEEHPRDRVVPPNCVAPGCQGDIQWSTFWDALNQRWVTTGSVSCVDYDRECDGTCACKPIVLQAGVFWDTVACSCGGAKANLPGCYGVFEAGNPFLVDPYFVECRANGCALFEDCSIVIPFEYRCACH
jgi:hypothetical protein